MSFSSLGAQLASLHSQSTNTPGSVVVASRRKEDAVGRGLHFSTQTGHSLATDRAQKKKKKPSVLTDGRDDVPLVVLGENALGALEMIVGEMEGGSGNGDGAAAKLRSLLEQNPSTPSERSLLTKQQNDELDVQLNECLIWLSCRCYDYTSTLSSPDSPILQILEYLLRRYDIHTRNSLHLILWWILPYHDSPPHKRLWQRLLELLPVADFPYFLWLRPYSIGSVTLPRTTIAKHCRREAALRNLLLRMPLQLFPRSDEESPSRHRILSFVCAVLVESMAAAVHQLTEDFVRSLFGPVLRYCRSPAAALRRAGCVLAAALAEHTELAPTSLERLCLAVLGNDSIQVESMLVVMAILPTNQTLKGLVRVPDQKRVRGYSFSNRIYERLCGDKNDRDDKQHMTDLLQTLSSEPHSVVVSGVLAGIVEKAVERQDLKFVAALAQSLQTNDWTATLVTSTVVTVMMQAVDNNNNDNTDDDDDDGEALQTMLSAFRSNHPTASDLGLAHVVKSFHANPTAKQRLAALLGVKPATSTSGNEGDTLALLPPRLALEHPAPAVRLGAVDRLDPQDCAALLRHVLVEEQEEIVLAAAQKVLGWFQSKEFEHSIEISQLVSQTASRQVGANVKKVCLSLCGYSLRWTLALDKDATQLSHGLMVGLVAHLDNSEKAVVSAAQKALSVALGRNTTSRMKKELLQNSTLAESVKKVIAKPKQTPLAKPFLVSYLSLGTKELVGDACVAILGMPSLTEQAIETVIAALRLFLKETEDSLNYLPKLLEVTTDEMAQKVLELVEEPVSLFELASQESVSATVVERLLRSAEPQEITTLVFVLALLTHTEQGVRKEAMKLLKKMPEVCSDSRLQNLVGLVEGTDTPLASSILLDGVSALPVLLRKASESTPTLKDLILEACVKVLNGPGSRRAISIVLSAAELAGEVAFPLIARWETAGLPILDKVASTDGDSPLVDVCVRMLKGALVQDPTSVVRPRGNRARAYSFGNSSGVAVIHRYPESMIKFLLANLKPEAPIKTTSAIVRSVIARESWVNSVFRGLKNTQRVSIASALLHQLSADAADEILSALLNLPLDGKSISALLKSNGSSLVASSALTDHIRSNTEELANQESCGLLIKSLFTMLEQYSSANDMEDVDDGEVEYVRTALMAALVAILQKAPKSRMPKELSKTAAVAHSRLLLTLIGGPVVESRKPLSTWKAKKVGLSLLAEITTLQPSAVVEYLIPALISCTISQELVETKTNATTASSNTMESIREAFAAIIPIYHVHSKAVGISTLKMFIEFYESLQQVEDEQTKHLLYEYLAEALAVTPAPEVETPIWMFIVLLVSRNSCDGERFTSSSVANVTEGIPVDLQITTILHMSRFTRDLLASYAGKALDFALKDDFLGILQLGQGGNQREAKEDVPTREHKELTLTLSSNIIHVMLDMLSSAKVNSFIQKADSSSTKVGLGLWQELLLLQSAVLITEGEEGSSNSRTFGELQNTVDECISTVQHSLPVHAFLASTTSLIEDGDSPEIRARALRLLVERSAMFDHESEEAALFLDMLPILTGLVKPMDGKDSDSVLIQQAASVVVEQFVRSFCLPMSAPKLHMAEFQSALASMAQSMEAFVPSLSNTNFDEWAGRGMVVQTACSLAICAASIIRLLKARCLPILPKLMKSMAFLLSLANSSGTDDVTLKTNVILVQVSAVRLFTAVADSLPKFMGPYLNTVLSPSVLVPLHAEETTGVEGMERVMSEKVPTRQLIPAICKTIAGSCVTESDFEVLLSLLQSALAKTQRAELNSVSSHVVQALFKSYESGQIDESNSVLLAMVMKLSEAQLRPVYLRFFEWQAVDPKHKLAFWSLSASLASELKFLFLPCLSSVVDDAVEELQQAISILSRPKEGKTKKAKVGSTKDLNGLPQLLRCLGHAFQADARQGGSWIRDSNDRRYHRFMEPMAKLLHAKVPSDFSFTDDDTDDSQSPYERLIATTLVSTIVSLAAAAGSDTLWKPLNHYILEACDDEDSVEVPRAGLKCLHSLMKTLGEEYMVLLPECLPTLSELLEADEQTSQMARACVSLAEDLLGESLEDSLR